jgi:hypothetical protein
MPSVPVMDGQEGGQHPGGQGGLGDQVGTGGGHDPAVGVPDES